MSETPPRRWTRRGPEALFRRGAPLGARCERPPAVQMTAQVAFDVGGTFTDFVLQDEEGRLHTHKVLTTYPDPSDACLEGLEDVLRQGGLGWQHLTRAVHGTT